VEDIQRLAKAASQHGIRIAVAESLTSGLLAGKVGEGEDAASWFAGAVVAYFTEVKESVLGLEPGVDPCSPACAEQLARGVRALMKADLAFSTTGVGGPAPADGHEPGTVYVGWASAEGSGHRLLRLDGEPSEILAHTVDVSVRMLADLAEQMPARTPSR
jgi:nicotinamide-nucleotide amidase